MAASPWFLKRVSLCDILGFQGTKELSFHDGLQVIEASNHTGKSSLAIALMWGLTGQVPDIDRISASQFKIKNKLAGDSDRASIEVVLGNSEESQMTIRRSTKGSVKSYELTVILDSYVCKDAEAQAVILKQLGLKPHSLEGCCVVLQDQRLSLISGDAKKSSETIHDVLGLSTLTKLIPIIKEKSKDLEKLVKTYEGIDPIKKWNERHHELVQELNLKENEAVAKGYDRGMFKSSQFLSTEIATLFSLLEIRSVEACKSPKESVVLIREAIRLRRNQHPHHSKSTELLTQVNRTREVLVRIHKAKLYFRNVSDQYKNQVGRYQLERLGERLCVLDAEICTKRDVIEALRQQQGLFSHALALISDEKGCSACPLCAQPVEQKMLAEKVRAGLGEAVHLILHTHAKELKDLEGRRAEVDKLQTAFRAMEAEGRQILEDLIFALTPIGEKYAQDIAWLQRMEGEASPDKLNVLLTDLEGLFVDIQSLHQAESNELHELKERIEHSEQTLRPIEDRLDRLTFYLVPVYEIQRKLEEHRQSLQGKEGESQKFRALLDTARNYLNDLNNFKSLLQIQEKEKANQAIARHRDFVSNFFAHVAANPNYDAIAITAKEMHGSVKYDFEARSTKNPDFTDAAKHVLSGGDLSCACLGLMLSLTQGTSNKAGFLMLDDPGESLDGIRMDNFAKELQSMSGRQTIILTHQNDLAEKLRKAGASSMSL